MRGQPHRWIIARCATLQIVPICLYRSAALSASRPILLLVALVRRRAAGSVPGLDAATRRRNRACALIERVRRQAVRPVRDACRRPADGSRSACCLVGAGPRASFGTALARQLATAAGAAGPSTAGVARRVRPAPGRRRPPGDSTDDWLRRQPKASRSASSTSAATRPMDPAPPPMPAWTLVLPCRLPTSLEARRRQGTAARRVQQPRATARQRAWQRADAARVRRRARQRSPVKAASRSRFSTKRRSTSLGMGLLLGVARGSSEPPRLDGVSSRSARRAGRARARPGRQGDHVRHRRDLDQAGRRHGADEGRHGGRRGGRLRHARHRRCSARRFASSASCRRPRTCPAARPIKPGDILRSAEGKTVEVINTDAEGRLVLGDGLWYARKLGATHLVDVATLTGAVVVALGKMTTRHLRARPDEWVSTSAGSAMRAGDRMWQLPLVDEYGEQLKSDIADFTNTGGRPGWLDHGRALPEGVLGRPAVGPPRHRRHGVGRGLASVPAEGARAASPCARSPSWRSRPAPGPRMPAD